MTANRILDGILTVTAFLVLPIMFVTTLLLGIAVQLTFGLLLLPISLVWLVLYCPMLGLSWICHKAIALRNVIGIIFIPWAVVADTFVTLMPSMGELESRASKLMLCQAWPFTWEFRQFLLHRVDLESADPASVALNEVVTRMSYKNPLMQRVIMRVSNGEQLDPDV
jgi:hypothetical protein